jgi:hypothetical protein
MSKKELDPQIKITIGDGRGKNGEMEKKQPNTFRGHDAPAKAVRFLRDKFPGQVNGKGEA